VMRFMIWIIGIGATSGLKILHELERRMMDGVVRCKHIEKSFRIEESPECSPR